MKMDAADLSRMNRVLRHRLRNSVSGIKGSATLLGEELKDLVPPDIIEYFPLIQQECDRLSEVTDRLNALFDGVVPALPDEMPARTVEHTAGMLIEWLAIETGRRFPGAQIETMSDPEAARQPVGDAARLWAALIELAVNACEAATRTYPVYYSFRPTDDGALVFGVGNKAAEPWSAEAISTMFAPFYTTKSRHLGIGLNLARKFAGECGANLSASPNPDGGLTFQLRAPSC